MKVFRYALVKFFMALLAIFALALFCFAQNSNSSSPKSPKKSTKRKTTKKTNLDEPDLTGIDLSVFDWIQVGTTNDLVVSYGTKTIKRLNSNLVRAWIKMELKDDSDQTRSEFLRNRRAQSSRTLGYENYSHTLELDEYNYANQ